MLSLDAAIAVVIVSIIVIIATTYITKSNNDYTSRMQLVKLGNDMVAVLDYGGALNTLNSDVISSKMNNILPIGYNMKIRIETNSSRIVETIGIIPEDRYVFAGRRLFVITNSTDTSYAKARFWIWNK
ncbi:hypothetical protein HYX19_04040 [Candidatus Woesearchaeota archaeon]|nr:hypothetical protein [Candidatus Woesearchaeota archaeon]